MHTTWDALGALWEQGAMATAQLCLTCYCSLSQLFVGVFWTCSYIFYQLFVFSFFLFFGKDLLSYTVRTNSFNEFFSYNIKIGIHN